MADDSRSHLCHCHRTMVVGAGSGIHSHLSLFGKSESPLGFPHTFRKTRAPPQGSPHTFALMMVHCRLLLSWS